MVKQTKFKNLIILILLIFAILFVACVPTTSGVTIITSSEAYEMMNNLDDFVLIDVRTSNEFRQQRIEGAINIPHNEIVYWAENNQLSNYPISKDAVILVYCQSGNRSRTASRQLSGLGFTNVHDFGGINSWPFGIISG